MLGVLLLLKKRLRANVQHLIFVLRRLQERIVAFVLIFDIFSLDEQVFYLLLRLDELKITELRQMLGELVIEDSF